MRNSIEERTDAYPLSFLMIGQSNMAGRGDINGVEPIKNPNCFMFRMGYWNQMTEPINIDRGTDAKFQPGISLAASFADELSRFKNIKVGLIPCARGGSSIKEWMPGSALFDHAVYTTELAKRTSVLGGIIWHQGEDDCHSFDGDYYKNAFCEMITELRKRIGAEKLPLIIGELGEGISPIYNLGDAPPKFNKLLAELEKQLPYTALASSAGIPLRKDGIHFSAVGSRIMGKRYFEKYKELTEINCIDCI